MYIGIRRINRDKVTTLCVSSTETVYLTNLFCTIRSCVRRTIKNLASSAKGRGERFVHILCKLFTKLMKNKGPKMLPWGTPPSALNSEGLLLTFICNKWRDCPYNFVVCDNPSEDEMSKMWPRVWYPERIHKRFMKIQFPC